MLRDGFPTLMRRLAHDWQRVSFLRWSSGPTIRRIFIWRGDKYDWVVSRIIMSWKPHRKFQMVMPFLFGVMTDEHATQLRIEAQL
jgi:hypothetical protein